MSGFSTLNLSCAECNHADAGWVSINRCVLLCTECAFVHRTLGPEFSRVKSKTDKTIHNNVAQMVTSLAPSANQIWEHVLQDPSFPEKFVIKRPNYNDPLDVKWKFIYGKYHRYQKLRNLSKDNFIVRCQELHSVVRTSALETTLRLLVLGADPNYFHPDKGTRPLHVAAKNGQMMQIELLHIYGAKVEETDYLGQLPHEHAAGNLEVNQRLTELFYQAPDRLHYFLYGSFPDRKSQLPPLWLFRSRLPSSLTAPIKKLSPNALHQFIADLYDEVDRRAVESELDIKLGVGAKEYSIAFLPVNQEYPATRNQTRQKLARLMLMELFELVEITLQENYYKSFDGLDLDQDGFPLLPFPNLLKSSSDPKSAPPPPPPTQLAPPVDDDYPLYDSVASDEDLVLAEQQAILAKQNAASNATSTIANVSTTCNVANTTQVNGACDSGLLSAITFLKKSNSQLEKQVQELKDELLIQKKIADMAVEQYISGSKATLLQAFESGPSSLPDVNDCSDIKVSPRKSPRPSSFCDAVPSQKFKENGLQDSAGKSFVGTDSWKLFGPVALLQETTGKVVRQIKDLVEFASYRDSAGLKKTCDLIFAEISSMLSKLILESNISNKTSVKKSLEKTYYEVLRMRSEIYVICGRTELDSVDLVTEKVKKLSFDVGAALKEVFSNVSVDPA